MNAGISTDDTVGTNYSYITLYDFMEGIVQGVNNGYPWSGIERHWRDGNIIRAQASVVGWRRYARGTSQWICPMYYKIGGWEGEPLEVNCKTLRTWFPPDWNVLKQKDGDFDPPTEREPGVLSRRSKKTQLWYDCIKIK